MTAPDPAPPEGLSARLLDGVARYLAGPRDPVHLDYRAPRVLGLGGVRCGVLIDRDPAYYLETMPVGATSLLLLSLVAFEHGRLTVGPVPWRARVSQIAMDLFVLSSQANPTLAQQDTYALVDRLVAFLDRDPTCASGGYEAGGFDLGEVAAAVPGARGGGVRGEFIRPVPQQQGQQQWVHLSTSANQFVQE